MGLIKFRFSPAYVSRPDRLKRVYMVGPDRSPFVLQSEVKGDILTCRREASESGRVHVPWSVPGFGEPVLATSTLSERAEPYELVLELARGRLCELRDQMADWVQMGLKVSDELVRTMNEAQLTFSKAAVSRDRPTDLNRWAQDSLVSALTAGHMLIELYVNQVLRTRVSGTSGRLSTQLACRLDPDIRGKWASIYPEAFNAARVQCSWKAISPVEGQARWDMVETQLGWARKSRLAVHAGPLIDLRNDALPDWLVLWRGDYEAILGLAVDHVRAAISRFRGKIPTWTLIHRAGCSDALGLTEEDQIRLSARLLQVARQTDPTAQYMIGFDRPWSEWMSSGRFQLGPLHLADYLARSDLGLSGVELEIAPGYSSPGSHYRDIFDFSRLLDLYALVNLPLSILLAIPSGITPDAPALKGVGVETADWPSPPDEALQQRLGSQWVALAAAKPFVRSVTWMQGMDDHPGLYPYSGLIRPDGRPKPLLGWMSTFRRDLLN